MSGDKVSNKNISSAWLAGGVLVSGLSWYLSYGLNGNFWLLVWFAPLPILLLSLKTNGKITFITAFLGYLIGRLSWFSYLTGIATIVPTIIFILLLSLIFGLIVILTRWFIFRINNWYSIFVFPIVFTVFEYVFIKCSPHGTAFSIAYTQINCVPLIQIASVTGILGVTFMVLFIPSAIALAWYYRDNLRKLKLISGVSLGLIGGLFLFGFIRSGNPSPASKIKVGLAVLDEKMHSNSDHPVYQQEKIVAFAYARQISMLASKGTLLVLLPERAIGLDSRWADSLKTILGTAAKQNHVFVIMGNTNVSGKLERNSALVFDSNGDILVDYTKKYLIPGLESQFIPGKQIGLFNFNGLYSGIAICKDLDFPEYIRQYGAHEPQVLFVPAWDFGVDDWFHSRMAILRSVENGFSQVRCARKGRLTINDPYGNVTFENSSANGKNAYLLGTISPEFCHTFYSRFGDWFGPLNLIALSGLIIIGCLKRTKHQTAK